MDAKHFFQNFIADNNYQGISLNMAIQPSWHDDVFHNRKRNKENFRREGISNFINELYRNLASKNLSELNISQITFDEEFEANQEQKIFNISGDNFDNLKIYTGNIVGSIVYKSHNFNINCRFGNEFL